MKTHDWLHRAHRNAAWLIAIGAFEVALGLFAVLAPFASGLTVTVVLGATLLLGGIARLIASFGASSFGAGAAAFGWSFLLAFAGLYLLASPASGLLALTLVLGLLLFMSGLVESYLALRIRPAEGWGWLLTGGLVSILLAVMVASSFPFSAAWLVGTAVGVHLVLNGFGTIAIGGAARRITARAQDGGIETGVVGPPPLPSSGPHTPAGRQKDTGDGRLAS